MTRQPEAMGGPISCVLQHGLEVIGYHPIERRRLGDRIRIDFNFDFGIAPFSFARLEPHRVALCLGEEEQLLTTHWTIKNANLLRVLGNAGLRSTVLNDDGAAPLPTPRGATVSREADLELLLASLRRVGDGAVRPLLKRRVPHAGLFSVTCVENTASRGASKQREVVQATKKIVARNTRPSNIVAGRVAT